MFLIKEEMFYILASDRFKQMFILFTKIKSFSFRNNTYRISAEITINLYLKNRRGSGIRWKQIGITGSTAKREFSICLHKKFSITKILEAREKECVFLYSPSNRSEYIEVGPSFAGINI